MSDSRSACIFPTLFFGEGGGASRRYSVEEFRFHRGLKSGIRYPESGIGNPETGIGNPESGFYRFEASGLKCEI